MKFSRDVKNYPVGPNTLGCVWILAYYGILNSICNRAPFKWR